MSMSTGSRLGRYEIVALLGAGGMGEVYHARDSRLERDVAIKVLPPELAADRERIERFEREARAAGRLNHPVVTIVHDVGTHDGTPYLVCELLEGETLGTTLKRGSLPPRRAIDCAVQIARGLAAAHDVGVVHRDLKPENLFLLRHDRIKILDFGLAKLRETGGGESHDPRTMETRTLPGVVMGTAGYMAPEQVQGLPADSRCDIFALGAILYEMLSGRRAFAGDSAVETMHQVLTGAPAPLADAAPGVSPALEALVRRCLEKRPEQRFQSAGDLAHALEALSSESGSAPSVATPAFPQSNLPVPLSSFVGRERELEELSKLVARSRLVTLSGPGGCGKTRLAIEVAQRSQEEFPAGVFLVELAPVADAGVAALEAARTLDVREAPGEGAAEAVARRIGHDRLLLVLDNCEHLIDAAAELAETLLAACPQLAVLATSREPLRVTGEVVRQVSSLTLPDPNGALPPAEELLAYDAVRLFVERASAAADGFALDDANAADVMLLCHRLDGFPLALELAAARVPALSVAGIVGRLDDRFRLLAGGRRTALTRQQTLQATVDWSFDLLTDAQRAVFCRLAVFHGGFDLAAAEAVCAGDGVDPGDVAVLVGELVERSMVLADVGGPETRYRLLETMREYGAVRLRQAGGLEAARDRHSRWIAALVERAAPELAGAARHTWLSRLDAQRDDLRAALDHLTIRDPPAAARLVARLWPYWLWYGYLGEGIRRCDEALTGISEPSLDRAEALLGLCALTTRWATADETRRFADRSLAEARATGDDRARFRSLWFSGIHPPLWHTEAAERRLEEALFLARRADLRAEEASALHALGAVACYRRDLDRARRHLEEALEIVRGPAAGGGALLMLTVGGVLPTLCRGEPRFMLEETFAPYQETAGPSIEAYVLAGLGNLARLAGRPEEAESRLDAALAIYQAEEDESGMALAHCRLGQLALAGARFDAAKSHLKRSLAIRERIGDARGVAVTLMSLGHTATEAGDLRYARAVLRRAETQCRARGDLPILSEVLGREGLMEHTAGDADAAVCAFEEAVRLQVEIGGHLPRAVLRLLLAEARVETGATGAASEDASRALGLFDAMGYVEEAERCRRLLADISGTSAPSS